MRLTFTRRAGLAFVFLWFLVGGIAHFVFARAETAIVPPYIPEPAAMVAISGVFELLGAFGILWQRTRQWAGNGLVLLTICVTPANVYMLQHAENYPQVPHWALVARLFFQVLLIVLIWKSTRVWDPSRRRR